MDIIEFGRPTFFQLARIICGLLLIVMVVEEKEILAASSERPENPVFMVRRTTENFMQVWKTMVPLSKKPARKLVYIGWSPPPSGFLKLYTDGSSHGNPGLGGAGGVL